MEILFHSEATPRVNMLMTKLKNPATAQIKSVDSFIKENEQEKDKTREKDEEVRVKDEERNGERDDFFRENRQGKSRTESPTPEMQEKEKEELTIWERYLKQFEDDEKPNLAPSVQELHPAVPEKRKGR